MEKEAQVLVVIDTNIFVDHLRNFAPATKLFENLHPDTVFFSAVTESELLAGRANNDEDKREALLHFLYALTKVEMTNLIAVRAGDIARQHDLDIPDAIIAATALEIGAVLLTRNTKHFEKVDSLKVKAPY